MLTFYINVRNVGNYCSKACQTKQYPEHKKYCVVNSELDIREKHKLEQFTVTNSELYVRNIAVNQSVSLEKSLSLKNILIIRPIKDFWIRVQWLV